MSGSEVKAFWDDMAKTHGPSDHATAPDHHYRQLEIRSILEAIGELKHETILDVGCGNGYTTMMIARQFPEALITGLDYSEDMIAEACKLDIANAEFVIGDARSLSRHPHLAGSHFDIVLSTRCLINLKSWAEQQTAILEMQAMMRPKGRLILVENILDGLRNLNALRARFGLHAIEVRWHNRYIGLDELMEFLAAQGFAPDNVTNIGNMYYIASRVIYAKLCKDQGIEPDYDHPINAIAAQLPSMGQHYMTSPNFMFICREFSA